jgi:1,3-beta-glucan synthase
MSGHPPPPQHEGAHGHYDDGYDQHGQQGYYQDAQGQAYYDQNHQHYDAHQSGGDAYYDDQYVCPRTTSFFQLQADITSLRGHYPDQHQGGYAQDGAYYDQQHGYQGDEYYDNQYYDQGHAAAGQQEYGYNG